MNEQSMRRVASTLESVISDFGRRVAEDPRRLRGLLADTLGSEAADCQPEIDAVVSAAESGIATSLLTSTETVPRTDIMRSLATADPGIGGPIVDAWISALRVEDRYPTEPGPTVLRGSDDTIGAADSTDGPSHADTMIPSSVATEVEPTVLRGDEAAHKGTSTPTGRISAAVAERKWGVAGLAVILIIMGFSTYGFASRDSGDTGAADEPTTTTEPATTTSSTTTTTTTPELLALPVETPSWGTIERTWEVVDGDHIVVTIVAEATTQQTGYILDAVPASLGLDLAGAHPATSAVAKPDGEALKQVHADATGARFVVALTPEAPVTIMYDIPLDSLADDQAEEPGLDLDALAAEWDEALAAFRAIPKPDVTYTADLEDDTVVISGKITEGAALYLLGEQVPIKPNGSFEHTITLTEGTNSITGRAVNVVRGNATTISFDIEYEADTTRDTTPDTTPVITPPGNEEDQTGPPAPTVSLSGPSSVMACTTYWLTATVSDATSGTWSGSWGWSEPATLLTLSNVSGDNATAYEITITYTATGPGGTDSASRTITVTPDNRVDYVRSIDECRSVAG